jgi:hypothetical protein
VGSSELLRTQINFAVLGAAYEIIVTVTAMKHVGWQVIGTYYYIL